MTRVKSFFLRLNTIHSLQTDRRTDGRELVLIARPLHNYGRLKIDSPRSVGTLTAIVRAEYELLTKLMKSNRRLLHCQVQVISLPINNAPGCNYLSRLHAPPVLCRLTMLCIA